MSTEHKLSAAIVSFGCVDLLSITLPRNLPELDEIVIVTKPEDEETINYCRTLNDKKIKVLTTDAFTFNRAIFNKGLAIGQAFSVFEYKSWFCTIDTDVILPPGFKQKFRDFNPNVEKFYGMPRINIDTREDFELLEQGQKKLEDFICYRGSGYGYFSMANYNSKIYQQLLKDWFGFGYPFWVKEARDIDWLWRNNWERKFDPPLGKFPECHLEPNNDYDTGLYEELSWKVIHLGIPGKNHEKRTTEKF